MTTFSTIASPGHRWKTFQSQAAAIQSDALSMIGAGALTRSRWLSGRARGSARALPQPRPRSVLA